MRVLLSAYACGPDTGSEPEIGLQVLEAALTAHEVWVLTQDRFVAPLRAHLERTGGRATVVGVGPDSPVDGSGLGGLARSQLAHDRWQRAAAPVAARLHREVGFDVVHHATLAAYWMRTGVADLPVPLVWGPVGGAVEAPRPLWPVLGLRGGLEDAVRTTVRLAFAATVGRGGRRADVVLTQNAAVARRLGSAADRATMLPNALATISTLPVPPPGSVRGRDVLVVGRAVPWKAVPLAVRVLADLPGDVRLRLFGSASPGEAARIAAAAERWGVSDRLVVEGHLPRAQLLQEVATAGVLLHPALHDESPGSVAEALALGTPVVALDHGGPAELVAQWPQSPAVLVPAGRAGAVAAAMAAACRVMLDEPPPVVTALLRPRLDFATEVLAAYARAARS